MQTGEMSGDVEGAGVSDIDNMMNMIKLLLGGFSSKVLLACCVKEVFW